MTLAEACAARGLKPESYRTPPQKFLAMDRLIPGKSERIAPSEVLRERGYHSQACANARQRYTENAAQTHRTMIAEGGIEAYVALFCQLNNLIN